MKWLRLLAALVAGIPPASLRVPASHTKTGWIGDVMYHDAAIVYPSNGSPYVLVVLTGGIKGDSVARNVVSDLSRLVYADVTGRPGGDADQLEGRSG